MKTKANIVIQTAFLGDLLLSIPMLQRLRKIDPKNKIILVCKKGLGDYFLKEKIVDFVYEVTKGNRLSYKTLQKKIEQQFKLVNLFCVHRSVRSQLFCSQLQAEKKIGFNSFLGFWIFDDHIEYEKSWPEVIRQWKILSPVDLFSYEKLLKKDWSYLNKKNSYGQLLNIPDFFSYAQKKTAPSSRKIAIFPGSVWATKKWTEAGFAEVGQKLQSLGYKIFLLGGPSEREICERVSNQISESENLAGLLSLTESIYFIKDCALVIANDSAPTHMASVEGVPVVSIFGPTTLDLGFRPWSNQAMVVENNKLDCRPCGPHGHDQCPLGHHKCMIELPAREVIKAALHLIPSNHEH